MKKDRRRKYKLATVDLFRKDMRCTPYAVKQREKKERSGRTGDGLTPPGSEVADHASS